MFPANMFFRKCVVLCARNLELLLGRIDLERTPRVERIPLQNIAIS